MKEKQWWEKDDFEKKMQTPEEYNRIFVGFGVTYDSLDFTLEFREI